MANIKVDRAWLIYFIVQYVYSFVALFLYSRLTTLGDTFDYLNGQYVSLKLMFSSSTYFIGTIAHFLNKYFGNVISCLIFCSISSYGILYSVREFSFSRKQKIFALLILSTPTFSIWKSVVSKEAILIFSLGIILGDILFFLKHGYFRNWLVFLCALCLTLLFKPLYMSGIVSLLVFCFLFMRFSLKRLGVTFLSILFILSVITILWFSADMLNYVIQFLPLHFSPDASSTRENIYFTKPNDIFLNAPLGIFLSLTGPTIFEALSNPAHFLAFIESYFLLFVFCLLIANMLAKSIADLRLTPFVFAFASVSLLWIILVNYPFGVLNPGSALRYRSGFFAYAFLIIYGLSSRSIPIYRHQGIVKG